MTRDELIETLASIEHQRWADWQKHVHSKAGPDPTHSGQGALLMMPEDVERWERQIIQPYAQLSETEKQSDRDQVARYWPVLMEFVAEWLVYQDGIDHDRKPLVAIWRKDMA